MNKTTKYIQMILLVLIVMIALGAYRFGYIEYMEKAEKVKAETDAIENQIAVLEEKETHRAEYEQAISTAGADVEEIISRYGTGNSPEKSIVFAADTEEAAHTTISNVSLTEGSVFAVFADPTGADAEGYTAVKSQMNISFETDYDGFKALTDRINSYPERMTINSLTASYDLETLHVYGDMVVNLYAITGGDREYKAPFVSGVSIGTDNIFEKTSE